MYRKFNLNKSSLSSCVAKRSELLEAIAEIQSQINTNSSSNDLNRSLSTTNKRIEEIESEIKSIQQSQSSYEIAPGLFNTIFRDRRMVDRAFQSISSLRDEIRRIEKGRELLKSELFYIDRVSTQQAFLDKLDKRIASLKNKEESIRSLKNRAALSEREKRSLVGAVKKKLKHHDDCPYCGGDLGPNPHADHIYPLSRGGYGVPSNMVLVCSSCNLKKHNFTLREFILKFNLDRDVIESRLEKLGKHF